jgi:hypothetical protein
MVLSILRISEEYVPVIAYKYEGGLHNEHPCHINHEHILRNKGEFDGLLVGVGEIKMHPEYNLGKCYF